MSRGPGQLRETSRDYAHPHRPALLRWLNTLGSALPGEQLVGFDLDSLEASARAKTRLEDFGDPSYREPLARLLAAMGEQAQLTPVGALIQHARTLDALQTRLRIEALFRQHPEIDEIELGPVITIAGLQRSGTTKLHRLLATDPETRALASWEALSPAPVGAEGRYGTALRLRRSKLAQHALRYMAPDFFAVHPVLYDEPEEDILLLDLCFSSQTPESIMHVPRYAAWVQDQDQRFAYIYLRRCMKLLSWQRPGRRWVLKSPHHLEHLQTLAKVFPELTIVQTHRDPRETTASFCSMVAHGRGVFSDSVDPHEVGRHWLAKIRHVGQRAQAARDGGELRICDVLYADLIEDPIREIARIYTTAGIELEADALAAMRKHDGVHRPNRYGRHRYQLSDFGLTPEQIDERLGFLREMAARRPGGPSSDSSSNHAAKPPESRPSSSAGARHDSAFSATWAGLLDLADRRLHPELDLQPVGPSLGLNGRCCLITGANTGLGLAVARALAERGAHLILACRSGIPETAQGLRAETGNPDIEMIHVDLADLDSVARLCDGLRDRGVVLDLAVLNAGLVPAQDRATAQGYEIMFGVHVLANATLLRRWIEDGVLRARASEGELHPRVVIVSSEAHRSAPTTAIADIGTYFSYGVRDGLQEYGRTKLMLCALAIHLRSLVADGSEDPDAPWLSVHALCPGPIASSIAREAPSWVRPVLDPVMRRLFNSPAEACIPVEYLACSPELEGHPGTYLHMLRAKEISDAASDPDFARAVWDTCARISRVR